MSKKTVIASNTSTLSINDISISSSNPNRVVGVHFFNPAYLMPLVEFISLDYTDENSIAVCHILIQSVKKKLIEVKDSPGFIVNNLLFPMINDAAKLLENNVADAESIDSAMKLGAGHPMGPLKLADLVGLDITVDILEALYTQTGNTKYIPADILKTLLNEQKLGRKSGAGFYTY